MIAQASGNSWSELLTSSLILPEEQPRDAKL